MLKNGKFGGPLFCGDAVDRDGDHRAFIANDKCKNPDKKFWEIKYEGNGVQAVQCLVGRTLVLWRWYSLGWRPQGLDFKQTQLKF